MKCNQVISDLYGILETQLSCKLTYHSIAHTRDVHKVCEFYIDYYDIKGKDKELLLIAAVAHDVGFTKTYVNHEEVSAEITASIMTSYNYSQDDVAIVSELILSTKIPQIPATFLARILCDADLDYLGRGDFVEVASRLKAEWINYGIVPNEAADFDEIQKGFLKTHYYHTDYALEHRAPQKEQHLRELIEMTMKCEK